jgi:hypothetical protein
VPATIPVSPYRATGNFTAGIEVLADLALYIAAVIAVSSLAVTDRHIELSGSRTATEDEGQGTSRELNCVT